MKIKLIAILVISFCTLSAQTESNPMLLGKIVKGDLTKSPYNEWFDKEYNNYEPASEIIQQLKEAVNLKDCNISIFLGTWCGDSHREVPRMIKVLEQAEIPVDKIKLIALNTGDNVHKQSPTFEEKGQYIFRVPTFIISENGEEINRIVEFPVVSLEKDLLAIVSDTFLEKKASSSKYGMDYSPNYRSYPLIINWLKEGTLTERNVSLRGLAEQLRFLTRNAGEINSAAYTLCEQGKTAEAAALCRIALALYPDNANYYSCAYIFSKNGDYNDAMQMLKEYLAKNTDMQAIESGLELYEKIKQNKTE